MTAAPEIRVLPDKTSFYRGAAELVVNTLASLLNERETVSFVLSGGDTPRSLYEHLAAAPLRKRVDWSRVHFFWSDERCVGPDDPQSNYGMAWRTLLSKINVPAGHIHRIRGDAADPEEAATEYETKLRNLLPGEPSLDLVLLGMGEDGHTASLFPGTPWKQERLVIANYVPKLQAWRISMTPRSLNAAATVVFLVAGTEKARAASDILQQPGSNLPAAAIHPHRGRLIWLLDQEAASLLQRNTVS